MNNKTNNYYMNNDALPTEKTQFEWTPDMIAELKKCQKDIVYFAEKYFYIVNLDHGKELIKLYKAQKRVLKSLVKHNRIVLLSSRQAGKALALTTPIPTPDGYKTMGELKDGDQVYDENGLPCNVIKAHDILNNRECYKITFDTGEEIIADKEHLWFTQTKKDWENSKDSSVKTTFEIYNTLHNDNFEPNHRIIKSKNFNNNSNKLNFDNSILSWNNINFNYIKNIEKVESVPVRCITVDSPNQLYLCGKTHIVTHNTTLITIFALWFTCFKKDKSILVVANKEKTSIEILGRVRTAYEMLPNWLKSGIKDYSKTNIVLANGSRIYVSTTATTAGRSGSINCIIGSEIISIKNKQTNEIITIPIVDLLSHKYK